MAVLSSTDVDVVWKEVMSDFSNIRREVPVNKNQLRSFLVLVDAELESAETSVVQAIPAGPQRNWLINNPVIGRELITRIEAKRRDVL